MQHEVRKAPARPRPAVAVALVLAALGTGALVVLSVPAALLLWVGVAVAVGRGDPTWNDGEEWWGTGVGLVLVVLLAAVHGAMLAAVADRTGRRVGRVVAGLSVAAVLLVHALAAAAFVGGV
ncbi:hypothetical protein JQN72_08355 [Phycicoccus sp. CSK15P-2]|uniref:hypothetical protein n=1 Tax=Phycicoccus sp. CSK15P-2 TaxID=2807627 RepID=UPI00194F1737|nr:hypothetical protein [Phycicoccus sp. CSK15P-2]MBM6404252.1 hypothetical protein [Phycicoccus sp. CSK15P-2]